MRKNLTTALECVGGFCIAGGVSLQFGVGFGLIIGGVLAVVFAYLADSA
jgi:hypothetical protein